MNQDICDDRTPIGQIIKQINALCKKPQVDDQLSGAIDTFREIVLQQQHYLSNGIFHTNFGEAALFLQSCAELYGKKIDVLWDQLLAFHTRLIEYDCEHEKQKGSKINIDVIEQLEERRNRYKRKKKFKLTVTQDDKAENFLYDNTSTVTGSTFDPEDDLHRRWRRLEYRSDQMRKIPLIVYKQQMKMYRMKNYTILKCQDFDVEDVADGEFNTRYSRIPGWHHLLHFFEYNTEGLLPDNNNIIAKLRLCMYKRLHFLRDRNIPLNTPFSKYKEEYLKFREDFFLEESKKWQNMPLDTLEDLHKQLEYLAQKEREANMDLNHNIHQITPVPKLINKDEIIYCSDTSSEISKDGDVEVIGALEPADKLIGLADDDTLLDLNFGCNDISKNNLFVRLENLSTDVISSKLRQDSGFYDEENDAIDSTSDHEANEVAQIESENLANGGDNADLETSTISNEIMSNIIDNDLTSTEKNADIDGNNGQNELSVATEENSGNIQVPAETAKHMVGGETSITTEKNSEASITIENNGGNVGESNSCLRNITDENNLEEDKENQMPVDDNNFDTRSIVSGHDYCCSPLTGLNSKDTNKKLNSNNAKEKSEQITPFSGICKIIPRSIKVKEKKVKFTDENDDCSLPKRRKLSPKQLEKLLRSLIPPTKEQKFEKFFSHNYQPQIGEGEIQPIDYESDQSDDEHVNELPIQNERMEDEDIPQGNDDAQPVFSEHSYCQPPEEEDPEALHDSGIADVSTISQNDNSIANEENIDNGLPQAESTAEPEVENETLRETVTAEQEEEYQRLLASLKESRRELNEEMNNPQASDTELIAKEKERREMRERVEEWKQNIMPILRSLKEQDFDIHKYGSKIMDSMGINEVKPFKEMVKGKPSSEVVRYFISTLQLANTYNIEIGGVAPGELSNETFALKLLKRDRYHEHLTDYEAPSKETFRERIKRMRDINKGQNSDADDEPLIKISKVQTKLKSRRQKILTYSNKKVPKKTLKSKEIEQDELDVLNSPSDVPEDVIIPQPAVERNPVAKNRSLLAVVNPLKGKSLVKNKVLLPRNTILLQEPSTSQECQSIELSGTNSPIEDSGYMSFEVADSSIVGDCTESSIGQPSTSLVFSPSEKEFRETLINKQSSELQFQSTPQTNSSTICSSKLNPRSLLF